MTPPPPPPPTIITRHLRLRPLTPHDTPCVITLRTNPLIFHWKTPSKLDTPTQAAQWLTDRLADPLSLLYAVEILLNRQDDGTMMEAVVIGLTGSHHLPEVGYIFDPKYWGKGYATEALRGWVGMYWARYPGGHPLLLEKDEDGEQQQEAREEGDRGGAPYLVAETGTEGQGKASGRVLQKCGFVFEKQRTLQGGEAEEERDGTIVRDCWRMEGPHVAAAVAATLRGP